MMILLVNTLLLDFFTSHEIFYVIWPTFVWVLNDRINKYDPKICRVFSFFFISYMNLPFLSFTIFYFVYLQGSGYLEYIKVGLLGHISQIFKSRLISTSKCMIDSACSFRTRPLPESKTSPLI